MGFKPWKTTPKSSIQMLHSSTPQTMQGAFVGMTLHLGSSGPRTNE